MLKLLCLSALVMAVASQGNNMMNNLLMMQMMQGGGGGGAPPATGAGTPLPGASGATGGASMMGAGMGRNAGGLGGMMGSMLNNPMLLCRQTENFSPIPCQNWRNICNIVSMRTYNFPNLMSCSPMGVGCCIKDAMSLMFVQRLG